MTRLGIRTKLCDRIGIRHTQATYSVSANFGLLWGDDGFINTTVWAHHNDAYDRSGVYTHSAGWYPDDPMLTSEENAAEDERLRRLNGIDLDRAVLGGAENTNRGIFINAGRPVGCESVFKPLPAGARTAGWEFYPLKNAALSRRTRKDIAITYHSDTVLSPR